MRPEAVAYFDIIWPSTGQALRMTARQLYYFHRHVERWQRRFGRPYKLIQGQVSRYDVTRFITNDIVVVPPLPVDLFEDCKYMANKIPDAHRPTGSGMPWYRQGQRW